MSSCVFALMMVFNVSVSMNNSNNAVCITLNGLEVMAQATQGECSGCSGCFGWGGSCATVVQDHYCGAIERVGGGEFITCWRNDF